jgi:type 1 glutamine amidotransferase
MGPVQAYFVCGGPFHDMDFPRVEILRLLNEHERIRVHIAESYSDIERIAASDMLVTFTVDVTPTLPQQESLSRWLASGGRWFALHGTNSILDFEDGVCKATAHAPLFMEMLGSQFVAHPPIAPYDVHVTEPEHPLTRGLPKTFRVIDELYLSRLHEPNRVLLHAFFNGRAQKGFEQEEWFSDERRPVMYLREYDNGEVLYLTLGHRRGRYDMKPFSDDYPDVEPGAWIQPSYYELLRRGIRWAARIET